MTLEILTSDALATTRHGFFTRRGGTSSGIFKGLNCGAGSSDQSEAVTINRRRVADAMQVPHDHLMGVHQIHSADVVTVGSATQDRPKADALVTATKGIALSVLSADCQPVLFCAAIGPCISQRAYEVGPDFMDNFMDEDPDNARFFAQGNGDKLQFDLPAFGLKSLRTAGITKAEWTRHCTYNDQERFYSYRRSVHQKEADYGRLIAAITI
jgi:copper oxidase (laccase) domain-containing protein